MKSFNPLFEQAERELKAGVHQSRQFGRDSSFKVGSFFVLGGLLVYAAEQGDMFRTGNNEPDARLRVVYANGTERIRSLQRALYKDDKTRMLTGTSMEPLFGDAQLDLTIEDRFGNPVKPRKWFLVSLHVIDAAVQRIRDGLITEVVYDP